MIPTVLSYQRVPSCPDRIQDRSDDRNARRCPEVHRRELNSDDTGYAAGCRVDARREYTDRVWGKCNRIITFGGYTRRDERVSY